MEKTHTHANTGDITDEMRSLGNSLADKGFLEFDTTSGSIEWANSYFLEQTKYEPEHLYSISLFDAISKEFHESLRNRLVDASEDKEFKPGIWPITVPTGEISWWYISGIRSQYSQQWVQGDLLQVTEPCGATYVFMQVQMNLIDEYGRLSARVDDLDRWVHERVAELTIKNRATDHSIANINKALDSISETKGSIETFKQDMTQQFLAMDRKLDDHTAEIIKLINASVIHSKRMSAFEKHVKMTTDLAIKSITMQTEKVGKGLSKKVAIPVSIISLLVTLLQYFIQNWPF